MQEEGENLGISPVLSVTGSCPGSAVSSMVPAPSERTLWLQAYLVAQLLLSCQVQPLPFISPPQGAEVVPCRC